MNLSSQGIKASIIFQALQGFRFPGDITSVEAETGDRIVFGGAVSFGTAEEPRAWLDYSCWVLFEPVSFLSSIFILYK